MATNKKRKRAVDHLTDALETEELAEKDFHVREALQLLSMDDG